MHCYEAIYIAYQLYIITSILQCTNQKKTHILLYTINKTLQVYIVSVVYYCCFYFVWNKAFNLKIKIKIKLLSVQLHVL